jgi:hypothetical protein
MQVINVPALPIITGISPSFGPISGGTIVTITGFNFTEATAVFFGTASAASFVVNSDTQITAVSPSSHAAGTVDIIVQTTRGNSALSPADQFTYQLISTTTTLTVSPNPAKRRQTVTLTSTVSPFSATGSVIFYSNNKLLGVARVYDGQAILITRFPHHGKQLIVAAYSGDNQLSGSISNVVVLSVGKSNISPPRHLSAFQRINSFHVVNILKWDAP